MNRDEVRTFRVRLSMAQKEANGQQWYKDQIDRLDTGKFQLFGVGDGMVSEYQRMKVNYDLFNNKLNLKDFEYVCKPYGSEVGELPAQMVNRDIVSSKIKSLLGMEMHVPFVWKAVAVNPEATTRKEQKMFGMIRDFVVNKINTALQQAMEQQAQQQSQAQQPNQNGQQASGIVPSMHANPNPNDVKAGNDQILQNIMQEQEPAMQQPQVAQPQQQAAPGSMQQEEEVKTPIEVMRYMQREYQDPAEILAHQLLEYLTQKCQLKDKFNIGFKHLCLSAREVYYIGIFNGEPQVWNVNSMNFRCDMSPDTFCTEDGEWATCEYFMTPSQVATYFGEYMTDSELDRIYTNNMAVSSFAADNLFGEEDSLYTGAGRTIRVLHCVWKALRKIQFLKYTDEEGEVQEMIVDETYRTDERSGDVSLESQWIPEVYEGWKIGSDIYVKMQPVPGQFKDIDNLYRCKLPYYGVICDSMNSEPVSLMDRIKPYQYYYNIVMYRLELLLASDKGKKVLMNINAIPNSAGLDIEKWQYFFEATPFMYYDPSEEGLGYNDVNTIAKQIDLSMASDISKYIDLAEYLKSQAGAAIGITERMEGEVGNRETSSNYSQALQQSANILEPYFSLHNTLKRNVLEALLEQAKVAYTAFKPEKITYITDDMTQELLNVDFDLLDNSTYGIFVTDSFKVEELKETITQLAHAALQNQQVELSDVISILRQSNAAEAEEILKVRKKEREEEMQKLQQQQQQAEQEAEEKKQQFLREQHEMRIKEIRVKEQERRKTELAKTALLGSSFNPDVDYDKSDVNDYMQLAENIASESIDLKKTYNKMDMEKQRLAHQRKMDEEKLRLEQEKIDLKRQEVVQKQADKTKKDKK